MASVGESLLVDFHLLNHLLDDFSPSVDLGADLPSVSLNTLQGAGLFPEP